MIVANDLSALSVCIWAAGGTKVLYDAHEYSLDQASQDRKWKRADYPYIRYTLNKYLHRCSAVCTVSDGIAEEYARVFGIERPTVVRNAAMFRNQPPHFNTGSRIRLVHHGVAARQRPIEDMIRVAKDLGDGFELDLYLMPNDPNYYDKIVEGSSDCERIHFHDPIPMPRISEHLNQYDMGLYILSPKNFNQIHALPNKIFEFIQARLAIAVSPSPEMAAVVREHNLGVVAKDFTVSAMVEALKDLSIDQINEFKRNNDHCAELLSAEKEMEKFERIIASLLEAQPKRQQNG